LVHIPFLNTLLGNLLHCLLLSHNLLLFLIPPTHLRVCVAIRRSPSTRLS
jgi:hypothetical protein